MFSAPEFKYKDYKHNIHFDKFPYILEATLIAFIKTLIFYFLLETRVCTFTFTLTKL